MTSRTVDLFRTTLLKAYCFIIYADGKIDEKEIALGKKIAMMEKINEKELSAAIASFDVQHQNDVLTSLKNDLKKLSKNDQVKIIAYMANVANVDGFMDPKEWKLIYKLYKEELNLPLEAILETQKQLPPFTK